MPMERSRKSYVCPIASVARRKRFYYRSMPSWEKANGGSYALPMVAERDRGGGFCRSERIRRRVGIHAAIEERILNGWMHSTIVLSAVRASTCHRDEWEMRYRCMCQLHSLFSSQQYIPPAIAIFLAQNNLSKQ